MSKVTGGVMDGVCWRVNLPSANSGLLSSTMVSEPNKFYVSVINIKSTGPEFPMLMMQSGGSGAFIQCSFTVPTNWKSIAFVGRTATVGSDNQLLYKTDGNAHEFEISGWQTLKFDTIDELYAFLESTDFVTDDVYNVTELSNASTSVPTKSVLNATIWHAPPE